MEKKMTKQELARRIVRDMGYEYQTVRNIIDGIAFEGWLHDPNQVPGRTITESESKGLFSAARSGIDFWPPALEFTGITVAPDPEPTNAEKIEKLLANCTGDVYDYAESIAAYLDKAGVKAPGGES